MKSNWLYSIPAIAYAVLIFALSAIPKQEMPEMTLLRYDKLLHLAEYTIFGGLLMLAFRKQGVTKLARYYAFGVGVLYSITDEIHQLFVPGRVASVYDLIADGLGIALGIYLFNHLKLFAKWCQDELS